jgi:hypothetical protein
MDAHALAASMREQGEWCRRLGSPLYHGLLLKLAEDIDAAGIAWRVLEPISGAPRNSLLPLRFLAALHRMAIEGALPELALTYPSCGGSGDPDAAWPALERALADRQDAVRANVPATVQTNEVNRCAALAPGFIEVARRTGLPLRLLEIGCSAGLNLRWDQYGHAPDGIQITERLGCDLRPIDPTTDQGRLTLLSFVWPDQSERFAQLSKAIEIARSVPATLERADAVDWMERQLAVQHPGFATVLFHSIVLLYLDSAVKNRVERIMREAGERATADAPIAWLSMEPGEKETDVHLTLWPSGERRLIARAGFHGHNVELVNS